MFAASKLRHKFSFTFGTMVFARNSHGGTSYGCLSGLQNRAFVMLIAICTYIMRRFSTLYLWLNRIDSRIRWQCCPFIFLLISIPCFKCSHLFFKFAYALGQRRLRLLCGEEFFLKFYNRSVANGSVVDVHQSLRYIESGLNGAQATINLGNHRGVSP